MIKRIIQIRKQANLSQEEFAKKLGLSRNFINQAENGKKNFSERTIDDICEKIKIDGKTINKTWLCTGKGEPLVKRTRNQEVQAFTNETMEELDESFKKRFLLALSKLDERDWETIEKLTRELSKETEKIISDNKFAEELSTTVEEAETEYIKSRLNSVRKKKSSAVNTTADRESKDNKENKAANQ